MTFSKGFAFITAVSQPKITQPIISIGAEASFLLEHACKATDGTILKTNTLSGTSIIIDHQDFISSQKRREVVQWEEGLNELLQLGFILKKDQKGEVLVVSKKGYEYMEQHAE